jgi:hypothetical protein
VTIIYLNIRVHSCSKTMQYIHPTVLILMLPLCKLTYTRKLVNLIVYLLQFIHTRKRYRMLQRPILCMFFHTKTCFSGFCLGMLFVRVYTLYILLYLFIYPFIVFNYVQINDYHSFLFNRYLIQNTF